MPQKLATSFSPVRPSSSSDIFGESDSWPLPCSQLAWQRRVLHRSCRSPHKKVSDCASRPHLGCSCSNFTTCLTRPTVVRITKFPASSACAFMFTWLLILKCTSKFLLTPSQEKKTKLGKLQRSYGGDQEGCYHVHSLCSSIPILAEYTKKKVGHTFRGPEKHCGTVGVRMTCRLFEGALTKLIASVSRRHRSFSSWRCVNHARLVFVLQYPQSGVNRLPRARAKCISESMIHTQSIQ